MTCLKNTQDKVEYQDLITDYIKLMLKFPWMDFDPKLMSAVYTMAVGTPIFQSSSHFLDFWGRLPRSFTVNDLGKLSYE